MPHYLPSDIEHLPTLCTGQCCSLKIETEDDHGAPTRVWLCRVAGGVTVEKYTSRGRWEVSDGGCYEGSAES